MTGIPTHSYKTNSALWKNTELFSHQLLRIIFREHHYKQNDSSFMLWSGISAALDVNIIVCFSDSKVGSEAVINPLILSVRTLDRYISYVWVSILFCVHVWSCPVAYLVPVELFTTQLHA